MNLKNKKDKFLMNKKEDGLVKLIVRIIENKLMIIEKRYLIKNVNSNMNKI